MDQIIQIAAICLILLGLGGAIGLADRKNFSPAWLLVSALLVLGNDAMLTQLFGTVPSVPASTEWNWQGKAMALALSLGIAFLGAFGWRRTGLTLRHKTGSLCPALIGLGIYCLFFLAIALAFDSGPGRRDFLSRAFVAGLE